jgi:hypothetical protein
MTVPRRDLIILQDQLAPRTGFFALIHWYQIRCHLPCSGNRQNTHEIACPGSVFFLMFAQKLVHLELWQKCL